MTALPAPATTNAARRGNAPSLLRSLRTAQSHGSNGSMDLPPIVAWQAELPREAAAGRGIDALRLILTSIRDRYAEDEPKLLEAVPEINDARTGI